MGGGSRARNPTHKRKAKRPTAQRRLAPRLGPPGRPSCIRGVPQKVSADRLETHVSTAFIDGTIQRHFDEFRIHGSDDNSTRACPVCSYRITLGSVGKWKFGSPASRLCLCLKWGPRVHSLGGGNPRLCAGLFAHAKQVRRSVHRDDTSIRGPQRRSKRWEEVRREKKEARTRPDGRSLSISRITNLRTIKATISRIHVRLSF